MRVLFLESHPMWMHGLPNGFKDLGHKVFVSGAVEDPELPGKIRRFQPDLVVSMGWGPENDSPWKQDLVRRHVQTAGVPHIYWATEDPTHTETFTRPFMKRVQPDFIFTICPQRVEDYRSQGWPAAHLDFGYHPSIHFRTEPSSLYRADAAVVANAYANRLQEYPNHYRHQSLRDLLAPLVCTRTAVDLYGRGWDQMAAYFDMPIPENWMKGYLPYTKANEVYSSAAVTIGLQNHRTQLTQRTYEVLGCGGFLLTSDTEAVKSVFQPGKHLVTSGSPEETVESLRYYLIHPEERERIRIQGAHEARKHSYANRAKHMIDGIMKKRLLSGIET